jgi:hypothetical protein
MGQCVGIPCDYEAIRDHEIRQWTLSYSFEVQLNAVCYSKINFNAIFLSALSVLFSKVQTN